MRSPFSAKRKGNAVDEKRTRCRSMDREKHIIWSDLNLDFDEWKEELETDYPGKSENELIGLMYEINGGYLEDERLNLDIRLPTPILVCADIGKWDGRSSGYKMIESGNIRDCLERDCDYHEWFIDRLGDLRCTAVHHDGINHYLYRAIKEDIRESQIERLQDKLYAGTVKREDITRVTRRLGDEIARVYGFSIPRMGQRAMSR